MSEFTRKQPDPQSVFEMSCDQNGRWCVRRKDGLVFGVFRDRRAAARFVWCECRSAQRLVLVAAPNGNGDEFCTRRIDDAGDRRLAEAIIDSE